VQAVQPSIGFAGCLAVTSGAYPLLAIPGGHGPDLDFRCRPSPGSAGSSAPTRSRSCCWPWASGPRSVHRAGAAHPAAGRLADQVGSDREGRRGGAPGRRGRQSGEPSLRPGRETDTSTAGDPLHTSGTTSPTSRRRIGDSWSGSHSHLELGASRRRCSPFPLPTVALARRTVKHRSRLREEVQRGVTVATTAPAPAYLSTFCHAMPTILANLGLARSRFADQTERVE
jgi:hypothetical protein